LSVRLLTQGVELALATTVIEWSARRIGISHSPFIRSRSNARGSRGLRRSGDPPAR
jgi:hypothetical protein